MHRDVFHERGRALEEAFFANVDQKLMDRIRERIAATATQESLEQISGLHDPVILQHLMEHNINAANFAALTLLPSVEIAWSDGVVSPQEREAVVKAAIGLGLQPEGPGVELLKQWLHDRPTGSMLRSWCEYAAALARILPAEKLAQVRGEIIGKAKAVAEASGGFLGLGSKISAVEQHALERFESALLPS